MTAPGAFADSPVPQQNTDLDRCVEAFQQALNAGRRPPLEAFLPPACDATSVLLELVHVELEFRLKHGEPAGAAEYIARYPQLGNDAAVRCGLVAVEQRFRQRRAAPAGDNGAGEPPTVCLPHGPLPDGGAGSLPTVPGYEIRAQLGAGGTAVVYQALQLDLNRTVALKMLYPGAMGNPEQRARFRTEAEAVARLQHPHIVAVHAVGQHEGRPFLTMEFLAGGSLADRLRGEPQPPRQAAALLETLARAVQYAHEHGVVHRDLKPANVLLQIAD
jgi:serine/threonine-protein kinase